MKIGIDMDGVLADFVKGFNSLARAEFGIDLPYPAPTWDHWKGHLTPEQHSKMWKVIDSSPFVGQLLPLPGAIEGIERLNKLRYEHDIYFITSRRGKLAKFYTEMWLLFHGMGNPTVLIAKDKGPIARGLKLDVFVDDKAENNLDVMQDNDGSMRVYLVDAPWNHEAKAEHLYGKRVSGINAVLTLEFPREERKAA